MTKEPTPDQTIEMLLRERDNLRDAIEGLRWMVNQMNKDSEAMVYDMESHGPVYAAVAYTFGPKCADYDPGCPCCEAWEEYDCAAALRADNERLRGALKLFACDCAENDLCKFPHACRNYIARAALDGQPAPGEGKPRTDSRYNNAERIFGDD